MPYVEPLFVCVQRGELKCLIDLLAKDPSGVNACDETGQTILHYACALGQWEIVIYLLNRYDCRILEQDRLYGYTPLHVACLYEQQRVVSELLKKLRSDPKGVNIQDKLGWTALHHAARNGSVETCKMLINHECQPDIRSQVGKTACHYAAEHGHLHVLKYLYDYVERKVTPPVMSTAVKVLPKNSQDKPPLHAPTLLHSAALCNQNEVIEWLKQKAYPPNAKWRRELDYGRNGVRVELPEEVAAARGHSSLRGTLAAYRVMYEGWIRDINSEKVTLDHIKLCVCGYPRAGKSAMVESFEKSYLQAVLGRDVDITTEDDVERHTFGINISSMHLSGKDSFSVWDFAGQVDSFITHQFFISTESTVFTVLVNLTKPIEEQKAELQWWLGFIKTRNLGQVPFFPSQAEHEAVPMPSLQKDAYRLLSVKSWMFRSPTLRNGGSVSSEESFPSRDSPNSQYMYGSVLQPVPVVIVGSHYDQIPLEHQAAVVARTQALVAELRDKFEEYLDVSPHLYPINSLRALSPEMKSLKEHLCAVRSKLLEVQPLYPRVTERVARKVEAMREEQPKLKVVSWERLKAIVHEDINRLLSEKQLSYICKCLANAGVLVYFQEGALANYVFIDPAWLCKDVLGKALAPGSFPAARLAPIGSAEIAVDILEARFAEHIDRQHIPAILKLLQYFELCHRVKDSSVFQFPSLITATLDLQLWQPDPRFVAYTGRHLVCADETDTFPPGFFSRLQVQACSALRQEKLSLFRGSFLVDAGSYQCLIQINRYSTAIDLIARTSAGHNQSCLQLLDQIHTMIAQLIRQACPTVFLDLQILSSFDLKAHHSEPHFYSVHEIIAADSQGHTVTNPTSGVSESAVDLLFCGDEHLKQQGRGKNTKVAYIPEEIICKVEELLEDGEKDWTDLARKLGLDKYIQLLKSRAPHSTRMLLLKWGEKPKWTVDSLLCALREIKRDDVYNFIRARMVKR